MRTIMKTLALIVFATVLAYAGVVQAEVDLEWRIGNLDPDNLQVGEIIQFGLYAVADNPQGENEVMSVLQVPIVYDPDYLHFIGLDNNGPYQWSLSYFPDDSAGDGFNNDLGDGDFIYGAIQNFTEFPEATPDGLLVTTFLFRGVRPTPGTDLTILEALGNLEVFVGSGEVPGLNLVGDLGSITIQIGRRQYRHIDAQPYPR